MKKVVALFLIFAITLTMFPITHVTGTGEWIEPRSDGNLSLEAASFSSQEVSEKTLTGITVTNQPKLTYAIGDSLDLIGAQDDFGLYLQMLKVTLSYSDSSTVMIDYDPIDFGNMGVTVEPEHGTILSALDHGKTIKVSCGGFDAFSNPLSVTEKPAGSTLNPATATYDKNLANQGDVKVEIIWGSPSSIIDDVKKGQTSIGNTNYNVFTEDDHKHFLSISKDYLATQPTGDLTLTVYFSEGDSALLTITIVQTASSPYWQVDSAMSVTDKTSSSVTLSWTPAQDAVGVTGYKVNVFKGTELVHTNTGTDTGYTVTGLLPVTTYQFEVLAKNAAELWTTTGLTVTDTTLEPPVVNNPPQWPVNSNVSISGKTSSSITLTWTAAQDDVGVTGYKVDVYKETELVSTVSSTETGCIITGLLPDTTYKFEVSAKDASNRWTATTITVTDSTPVANTSPHWPEGSVVSVSEKTSASVTLSWTAAQDDVGVTGYKVDVYKGTELVSTVSSTETGCIIAGLLPETQYSFKVEAVDKELAWSAEGPTVTVTTNPLILPEITNIKIAAPRENAKGSLYMGDTVKIVLTANKSGLQSQVIVTYREWNDERTMTEEKLRTVPLVETSANSKIYAADFNLTEGISSIISLEGQLGKDITKKVTMAKSVAGRLKVAVIPPHGLSVEELTMFNALMADSYLSVSSRTFSTISWQYTESYMVAEGLDQATNYMFSHFNSDDTFFSNIISIKAGLEYVMEYTPRCPIRIKVKVVDDTTGLPMKGIYVDGTISKQIGSYRVSGTTREDGFATRSDGYFFKGLSEGLSLELTTSDRNQYTNIADLYDIAAVNTSLPVIGDKEIEIRLKKVPIVTLKGVVTDSTGNPLEKVTVTFPQAVEAGGHAIYATTQTNKLGEYEMQVARVTGEITYTAFYYNIHQPVSLTEGVNIVNIEFQPFSGTILRIFVDVQDINGLISERNVSSLMANMLRLQIVWNGVNVYSYPQDEFYYVVNSSKPGDIIEVKILHGPTIYGGGSTTIVVGESNYEEVRVLLKPYGRVTAQIQDSNGNPLVKGEKYFYLYDSETGDYVYWGNAAVKGTVTGANVLCIVPEAGTYKAVFSQKAFPYNNLISWRNDPNCVITDPFQVVEGQVTDLGAIAMSNYSTSGYFRQHSRSAFTASSGTALPGSTVTLRVDYDFDRKDIVSPFYLDLVAQIPRGTTLVPGSVVHRQTRGDSGSVVPVVEGDLIKADIKECQISGATGSLTYQVIINDPVSEGRCTANAELRFRADREDRSEFIGHVSIVPKLITLDAPYDITRVKMLDPVKLRGITIPGGRVELYDRDVRIGEAVAGVTGIWSASVILPNRGAPIYHSLVAKTVINGVEHTDTKNVLVGIEGVELIRFTLSQQDRSFTFDPREGKPEFLFVVHPQAGLFEIRLMFSDIDKVSNVIVSGYSAVRQGNEYIVHLPNRITKISIKFNEEQVQLDEVLRFDHGLPPDFIVNAEVAIVEGTSDDITVEYGDDGYIDSFELPRVRFTALDGYAETKMDLEIAEFDVSKARSRVDFGNGLYGYDFSYTYVDGRYVLQAYVDRQLFSSSNLNQAGVQRAFLAAASKAETIKLVIDVAGAGDSILNLFGDLKKSMEMTQLLLTYEMVRPHIQPYLQVYYDGQIRMLGEHLKMGKTLSLLSEVVSEAGNLVPIAGEITVGIAGFITGKVLDHMFDKEYESDYNRLMAEFKRILEELEKEDEEEEQPEEEYEYYYEDDDTEYNYQGGYPLHRPKYKPDTGTYEIPRSLPPIQPAFIMDPSGFVYEGVEENRVVGVTATALFLPKEAAADAAAAKASDQWQVWDALPYLQQNPQTTDTEGRYAWDVPFGWWMVRFEKVGYQTAYSDALPVPPPQLDINIPMIRLEAPAVSKTVWGSGGRYVDIYFTKYMDMTAFGVPNAVQMQDKNGNTVSGTIVSVIPAKIGVNDLSLTNAIRFVPDTPLTEGEAYTLTVKKEVWDYAGFSMNSDYTQTQAVPISVVLESLSASDINVTPGKDITAEVKGALTFTAVDPAKTHLLDQRVIFASSNTRSVTVSNDGSLYSLEEGSSVITVTSVEDNTKSADFTVTVAYPPTPVSVSYFVVLDQDGKALTDLSIHKGDTHDLAIKILPKNASNKNVSYWSDNPSVVSVDQTGRVQGLSEGVATLIARTQDQNLAHTIYVKVLPPKPEEKEPPASGGIVIIQPAPVAPFILPYADVRDRDWFFDAVRFIAEKGITKGVSDTRYAPLQYVTRAEFVSMLCRAFQISERGGENFVDAGAFWYTGYLAAAKQLKLAQGTGGNRFEPERLITREEMAVMLYNYYKSAGKLDETKGALPYSDSRLVSEWALEALRYTTAKGWLKGKKNNMFDPKGYATRAELAQLFYNVLK